MAVHSQAHQRGLSLRQTLRLSEPGSIRHIACSADGARIAAVTAEGRGCVWDVGSGKVLFQSGADIVVERVWWHNASAFFRLQSGELLIIHDSTEERRAFGQLKSLGAFDWSPDGRAVAAEVTASDSPHSTVVLLDVATGTTSTLFHQLHGGVSNVRWSRSGSRIAVASEWGFVHIFDRTRTGATGERRVDAYGGSRPDTRWPGYDFDAASIRDWSPDDTVIVVNSPAGDTGVWNVVDGRRYIAFPQEAGFAWSRDGKLLAVRRPQASDVQIFHVEPEGHALVLEGHTSTIRHVGFASDELVLAVGGQELRVWRSGSWETVVVLNVPADQRWHTMHSAVAPILASHADHSQLIHLWELDVEGIVTRAPVEAPVHYTTARIALVGDSGVGKTGLGWRLAHGEFKETPSTHGQQFWVLADLAMTRVDGTECEAVLWDLAGQPDYRMIHALFLDDVDLALLLFDPTNRQEPLKGVEYWLKQLSRKGQQPAILIAARADRGTPTLMREELEEFCRRSGVSAGYVSTSALSGEGLAELITRMKAAVNWDAMAATVTTSTFKRVKTFVLRLKEDVERTRVLVTPAELRMQLQATDANWAFTDAEMMTAVGHLAAHGYVSALRDAKGNEAILLVPDLLANLAASLVLEARRHVKGLGALDEGRVLNGNYELPEVDHIDAREREVLLAAAVALFLEHNVCFRETLGTQTLLIFPALINQKRPLTVAIDTVDDFSYRVSGAIENVFASLVVQLGYTNTFSRTNQWQNQAEYETARADVCGFRLVEEREGEIELVLYHAKDRGGAALLFQGLFEEFLRGRSVRVTKYPPITCPNCRYQQQRTEVVKRVADGKAFLFCGECGERIMLPAAAEKAAATSEERAHIGLEQQHAQRRTVFESALVRVKAVVRDLRKNAPSCFVSYAWGNLDEERWVRGLAKDLENAGIAVILDQKDNPQLGGNIARFISRIEESEFVAVVGTPLYHAKYRNKVSATGSIVAAEVDLIQLRLLGTEAEKETVIPLLLAGDQRTSLPALLRGRVFGRFVEEKSYFGSLFDLILTLHRIEFAHPAICELRDHLRDALTT